ncbi:hypothetical protein BCR34DRAFT_602457 [Clohesyomyces aquaticus]|uniref:F-box domain-containing protein n=1 Tax=Clohesyomyces aquaticus TaxID=1231657 RepID=A0A1Y1ZIB4_9PLEO|nr:hypothetical protein BCR34DRAFT_602457 [Clohesyomyces aquaticus]
MAALAASSSMAKLPAEILFEISVRVKATAATPKDLLPCVFVSKRWKAAFSSVLYGNIAVTDAVLGIFLDRLNVDEYGSCIRSLTVHLTSARADIELRLTQLSEKMHKFTKLLSFSFRQDVKCHMSIPTSCFKLIVESLPNTCVNLELDTNSHNTSNTTKINDHVCESIHRILPRMEHLRLRLSKICSSLFIDKADRLQPVDPDFRLLPNIKSLVICCFAPWGARTGVCYEFRLGWPEVTKTLENLLEMDPGVPRDSYIYMLTDGIEPHLQHHYRQMSTVIRADMINKESWAIPCATPRNHEGPERSLVRLPNGAEVVTNTAGIESLAEDQLWLNAIGGARIPAAVLKAEIQGNTSFASGCIEASLDLVPIEHSSERVQLEKESWWKAEERVGAKIFDAEKRSGPYYLSTAPIVQMLPSGWAWNFLGTAVRV